MFSLLVFLTKSRLKKLAAMITCFSLLCLKYFCIHGYFSLMRESKWANWFVSRFSLPHISWHLHKVEPSPHCATALIFEDLFTMNDTLSHLHYVDPDVCLVHEIKERRIFLVFVTLLHFCILLCDKHLEKHKLFYLLLFRLAFSLCIPSSALSGKKHNQH